MKRNRTRHAHPAIISYGLYLYFSSRSLRLAARCLSNAAITRTHVVIWKWVQKYSGLADRFRMDKHSVKRIFVWILKNTNPNRRSELLVMGGL
jgi:hypothetical protein